MKKFLITLICLIGLVGGTEAQSKRITKQDLPKNVIEFVDNFYPNQKMVYWKEGRYHGIEYEVNIENGTSLEFDRRGKLKSYDCGMNDSIPYLVLPNEIIETLLNYYGQKTIIEYTIDDRNTRYEEHEIKFKEGFEITFSGRYNNKY